MAIISIRFHYQEREVLLMSIFTVKVFLLNSKSAKILMFWEDILPGKCFTVHLCYQAMMSALYGVDNSIRAVIRKMASCRKLFILCCAVVPKIHTSIRKVFIYFRVRMQYKDDTFSIACSFRSSLFVLEKRGCTILGLRIIILIIPCNEWLGSI